MVGLYNRHLKTPCSSMPLVENLLAPSEVFTMVTILQTHLGLKLHLGLGFFVLHQGQIGLSAT